MPMFVTETTDFELAPAGTHSAVCVDVIDLGLVETVWSGEKKMKHKLQFIWQIDAERSDGKAFLLGRRFTYSLNSKSSLRKQLETWRGKTFTVQELKHPGFDVESMIGQGALLTVIHAEREGRTYANVENVSKMPRGMKPPVPSPDYVRVINRTTQQKAAAVQEFTTGLEDESAA
jgi:hypothetical protein